MLGVVNQSRVEDEQATVKSGRKGDAPMMQNDGAVIGVRGGDTMGVFVTMS